MFGVNLKLDLLTKEIEDQYTRENFERIKRKVEAEQILQGDFRFFEIDITETGKKVAIKHNLNFIPKDIIILSKHGDHNLYFNYQDFDSQNIYITSPSPCRVRFLAGSYKDRIVAGKKDFTFIPPSLATEATWLTGAGNPTANQGETGDFYLNTTTQAVYLKTTNSTWTFQGYLNPYPASVGSQLLEIHAVAVLANTWTNVPLTNINKIADVSILDALNSEEVQIAWRIVGAGTQVEIYSKKANTYTVHVEGYKI